MSVRILCRVCRLKKKIRKIELMKMFRKYETRTSVIFLAQQFVNDVAVLQRGKTVHIL